VTRLPAIGPWSALAFSLSCWLGASPSMAAARASGEGSVALSISPVPTLAHPTTATPQVAWSTGNGSPGLVTVTAAQGRETLFTTGPDGTASAPWIVPGREYVFRLYSTVGGRHLLAAVKVGRTVISTVLAPPSKPTLTPAAVNRLLQLLPFFALVLVAVLTARYALELRRDR
jgi:hypothetical protein